MLVRLPSGQARKDIAIVRQPAITLYGKPDCHLCHEAREMLLRLKAEHPHELTEVDITTDAAYWERYRNAIPVLVIDDAVELDAPIQESEVRAALRARANG